MIKYDLNLRNLEVHLNKLFDIDLYRSIRITECPHCRSENIIKFGFYKNVQRYRCKECGKTFSNKTNTSFYYSKKNSETWVKYIELMLQRKTLNECSKELGISLPTAFYWRHKILFSLVKVKETEKLENNIHISKILIRENFKGERQIRNKERKNVWNVIAMDSGENIISRPISIGIWNTENFNKLFYEKIDKNAYINAYLDRYLDAIAKKHNGSDKSRINIELSEVLKNYNKTFKNFLKGYRGVATKYLVHYLYLVNIFVITFEISSLDLIYSLNIYDSYIKENEIKNLKAV
ncbi:IS1 family transposase [Clostridium paraputrificum]|uniref:IS1 family transposase n=1 Tax=Clostridium paraputrificum TaxID=29363 RepID=UPI0018992095|nr:IS1 family transposase [Clostridium paraputrificum]MDB2124938.1 hypothetical protein [Clostridium paraputrificum]